MKRSFFRALLLLAAPAVTECVDTSPLDYAPETIESPVLDGGSGDGNAEASPLILSCRKCISGDGEPCRPQYDACAKIDKCVPVLDCVIDKGCFEFSELSARFTCGKPCLDEQGVLAGNDPATQALAQINVCVVNSCSDACFMK